MCAIVHRHPELAVKEVFVRIAELIPWRFGAACRSALLGTDNFLSPSSNRHVTRQLHFFYQSIPFLGLRATSIYYFKLP